MGRLRAPRALKIAAGILVFCAALGLAAQSPGRPQAVKLERDDKAGRLRILIGGREALDCQYAANLDLPHYWPMMSPGGRNMLVEKTEPYPHHRAFWFADTVRPEGADRDVSFYNALYSGVKSADGTYGPPFRDRIRHKSFTALKARGPRAEVGEDLVWEMDGNRCVLDERRLLVVHSLGDGEYLLDIQWTLTASRGDVVFVSDDVHYAWPYLRLDPAFSGQNGGILTSDGGATGEKATNMQPACWMDYSNTIGGLTEGVAVFQWPDGREHRWLTREYGTFGPRRPDERSGNPFTLKKGESISQHVGVLVHAGDVRTGRVCQRYGQYIKGEWK
jgi:hypothetical protein